MNFEVCQNLFIKNVVEEQSKREIDEEDPFGVNLLVAEPRKLNKVLELMEVSVHGYASAYMFRLRP